MQGFDSMSLWKTLCGSAGQVKMRPSIRKSCLQHIKAVNHFRKEIVGIEQFFDVVKGVFCKRCQ